MPLEPKTAPVLTVVLGRGVSTAQDSQKKRSSYPNHYELGEKTLAGNRTGRRVVTGSQAGR